MGIHKATRLPLICNVARAGRYWFAFLCMGSLGGAVALCVDPKSYQATVLLGLGLLLMAVASKIFRRWIETIYFLPFLYTQGLALAGCIILEQGRHMPEFLADSYQTGATARLLLLVMVMLLGFTAGWRLTASVRWNHEAGSAAEEERVSGWWLVLPFVYVVVSIYEIAHYGTALGSEIGRYEYAASKRLDITRLLVTWPLMFMLLTFVAAKSWRQKTVRWVCLLFGLAGLMRSVLIGNKYSALVAILIVCFVVWESVTPSIANLRKRLIVYAMISAALAPALGALIIFHYNNIQGYYSATGDPYDQMFNRLSAQGGVWWVTDRDITEHDLRLGVKTLFGQLMSTWRGTTDYVGLQFMSSFATSRDLSGQFLLGSAFTMAYPAIIILMLGWWWGGLVVFLIAAVCGSVGCLMYSATKMGSALLLLLWGRIYYLLWVICSTGDIQELLSWKFLCNVIVALAAHVYLVPRSAHGIIPSTSRVRTPLYEAPYRPGGL